MITLIKSILTPHASPGARSGIQALDGVRGIAVLFVLLAHTKVPGFDGQGSMGVYLFFALSGFLLTMPLVKWEQAESKLGFLRNYFIRRFMRIIPMYYSLLAGLVVFTSRDSSWFAKHALFISADDHLWSIRQELIFYLILPFVFLILGKLKERVVAGVVGLGVMGFLVERFLVFVWEEYQFPWAGEPLYPAIFLYGVLASVLWIKGKVQLPSWYGVVLLGVLLASNRETLNWLLSFTTFSQFEKSPGWLNPNFFGVLGALFVLAAVNAGGLLKRVLEYPLLRLCGVLGYSMYLLHWFVFRTLFEFGVPWGVLLFGATFLVTVLLSLITYRYIERPSVEFGKRITS